MQILTIVDIFDACRMVRPYKRALSFNECIAILNQFREKYRWDSRLTETVIEGTLKKFELRYASLNDAPA